MGSFFYWLYNINTWTISNPKILFKVEQDLVWTFLGKQGMVQECEELILDPNLRSEAPLNSKYLVRTQTDGSIKSLENLTELQGGSQQNQEPGSTGHNSQP